MEQLKRDRDYTSFLIRTIQNEISSNKFQTKNDLINYISKIDNDLRSNEGISYINNNRLLFNYQFFQQQVQMILNEYDRVHQPEQQPIPSIYNSSSVYQPNSMDNQQSVANSFVKEPVVQTVYPTNNTMMQQNVAPMSGGVMQQYQQPLVNVQPIPVLSQPSVNNVVNMMDYQSAQKPMVQDSYLPITKIDVNSISPELIDKINFVIVNPGIDVNDYVVDVKSGTFKNIKDNQVYDVRKNAITNSFELVSKNSLQPNTSINNSDGSINKQKDNNQVNLSMFSDKDLWDMVNNPNFGSVYRDGAIAELKKRESEGSNTDKTKKLIPDINNSAFASTVLLTGLSAVSGIIIASILLTR